MYSTSSGDVGIEFLWPMGDAHESEEDGKFAFLSPYG